jgi:hypothetical protein
MKRVFRLGHGPGIALCWLACWMETMMTKLRVWAIVLPFVPILALGGCGSGSGGAGGTGGTAGTGTPTGFLIDAAVSGVAYETPTHEGVTGSDGSFEYEEGETVRFMVGDTVLGETLGKRTVSPFDLISGAEVLIDDNAINAELSYGSPFSAVVNLAVLLQTLDQDGDVENGIEITEEVAAAFAGVELRLDQRTRRFNMDTEFRTVLADLNDMSLLHDIRDVRSPDLAIQHLYEVLEIEPQIFSTSTRETDADGDGVVDSRVAYSFDEVGHRIRDETDSDGDGTVDTIRTETWDESGRIVQDATDSDADGTTDSTNTQTYDEFGNEVRYEQDSNADGTPNFIRSTEFDRLGRPTRSETDSNADGVPESARLYSYDGNTTRTSTDSDADGTIDSITITERDDDGNTIRLEEDTDADGSADSIQTNEYNDRGRLTQRADDTDTDGTPDSTQTTTYDENGNRVRLERDNDADGTPDSIETWTRDENGLVTSNELDNNADGTPERVTTFMYDEDGNSVGRENREADVLVSVETREFDADGNTIRQENDDDADGTADRIAASTYALVGFAWIFDL